MLPFLAKLNHEFSEQDFIDSPVWATYYEPDEIETLVELGFDRKDVEQLMPLSRNNDEYSFPLPPQAAEAPFNYLYLGVRATTRGGNRLIGYFTGSCFGVFHNGKSYQFNGALRTRALQAAAALATALGEESVFPMQVEVMATGERKEEDLW